MGTPATITLTSQQVDSIIAQQGGSTPIPPTPTGSPDPGPGPGPIDPPSGVRIISLPWANSPNTPTGPISVEQVIAVEVTTGSISSTNNLPFIAASDYNSAPRTRKAVLSYTPGDFDNPIGNAPYATMEGKSITAKFALGTGTSPGYPQVPLNTRIYLNIKTVDQSSPDQSAEMFVSLSINSL